jgi:nucleotide-binding universal stress UspA family protein
VSNEGFGARHGLVVVGIDGSAHGVTALRWAIAEARRRRARVRVIHTWQVPVMPAGDSPWTLMPAPGFLEEESDALQAGGRMRLARTVEEALGGEPAGVELEQVLALGDPGDALVEQSGQADLLVVGSRGHGAIGSLFLGSVSRHCANHAACPVVIVRGEEASDT